MSTVEIRRSGGDKWIINQNMGKKNAIPPRETNAMANLVLSRVTYQAKNHPEFFDSLQGQRLLMDPERPLFGATTSEKIQKSYDLWRPILPKSLSRKGMDGLIDKVENNIRYIKEEREKRVSGLSSPPPRTNNRVNRINGDEIDF